MDMWTMRLRRTGLVRGRRDALPTADPFAHMPTAFQLKEGPKEQDDPVAFFREATWGVSFSCRLTQHIAHVPFATTHSARTTIVKRITATTAAGAA
jgi:hypothetical protein